MRFIGKICIFLFIACAASMSQVDTTQPNYWMMTYFINGEDWSGARVAFSSDTNGLLWQEYNNQTPILVPVTVAGANDYRMRDPMIEYDSLNNKFNFVWTVSWTGVTIGWDTCSDLLTWGPQQGLQVGSTINGYCCWAPEIFWNDLKGQWQIIWSTCQGSTGDKHTYYTLIPGSNFLQYSTPTLMFNPGFTEIDADMMKVDAGEYMMVFKDERNSSGTTESKNVHFVIAPTPTGPWKGPSWLPALDSVMSPACTNDTIQDAEGPTIVKQGGMFHLFFDPYNSFAASYRMVKVGVKDLDTTGFPWPSGGVCRDGSANFVWNHSNVVGIPRRYVMHLLYGQPLPAAPAQPALQSPANASSNVPAFAQLSWSSVGGATGYNVEISTTSDFEALAQVMGTASDSATAPSLTELTTYYWRVNASSAAAGAGVWSGAWLFTLGVAVLPRQLHGSSGEVISIKGSVLSYVVAKEGPVAIAFKDMLGRTTTVLNCSQAAGHYSIGLSRFHLAAGQYVVHLKCSDMEKNIALTLTK